MSSVIGGVVKKIQEVTKDIFEGDQVTAPKESSDFEATLSSFLKGTANSQVNEEELFAAIIGQRLEALKGSGAKAAYEKAFETQKIACRRWDGRDCIEAAAEAALRDVQDQQLVSKEEATGVRNSAFAAAQLDDNKDVLYDGIGGPGDPTMAIAKMESAMLLVKAMLEKIDSGTLDVTTPSVETGDNSSGSTNKARVLTETGGVPSVITPNGSVVDGPDGFLFKPISSNEGRLAVLLPAQYTGQIEKLLLKNDKDEEIESGRFTSDGTGEGGRTKYAFSRQGGEYSKDLTVELHLKNGKQIHWKIANPALRYD